MSKPPNPAGMLWKCGRLARQGSKQGRESVRPVSDFHSPTNWVPSFVLSSVAHYLLRSLFTPLIPKNKGDFGGTPSSLPSSEPLQLSSFWSILVSKFESSVPWFYLDPSLAAPGSIPEKNPYQTTNSQHILLKNKEGKQKKRIKCPLSKDKTRYQHLNYNHPKPWSLDNSVKTQSITCGKMCLH